MTLWAGLMGGESDLLFVFSLQVAPPELQCSVFCGGRRCRYDSSDVWKAEDMAIDGIFSHW